MPGRSELLLVALLGATAFAAEERVDQDVIARIKAEAFQRSAVMDTLSYLTDVHGPRLSGSPTLRAAAEWSRDRLKQWGVANAAFEPYDYKARGWSVQRHSVEMTAPQYARLVAYPRAWSPSTNGAITGSPVFVEIAGETDFPKYHGKLRGAIVLNGRPSPAGARFEPEAKRLSDQELQKRAEQIDPTAPEFGGPASLAAEEKEWTDFLARRRQVWQFFADEGAAVVIDPSPLDQLVVSVAGFYDREWQPSYPGFVMGREHYGRLVRLLDRKVPVTVELNLHAQFHEPVEPWFNVVAEIPGADPVLAPEVVMLGAHLDSWHAGTGATDNASGCAVMLEAIRILRALDLKPRRTIRVALWTGEEQDYLGSRGYIEQHFSPIAKASPKPDHARVAAYFNLDSGTGRIRGLNLQGNEAVRPMFAAWLEPFAYLGATTLTTLNTGGTDHLPFDAVGLPGFEFIQDPIDYNTETHHTNLDLYEAALEDDLKQASAVVASFAYHAAMRDEKLPRKPR